MIVTCMILHEFLIYRRPGAGATATVYRVLASDLKLRMLLLLLLVFGVSKPFEASLPLC